MKTAVIEKAKQYNVSIHIKTEEYTTKTCTNCGHLHKNVGGKKMLKCPNCNLKFDRDISASRNIFLKNTKML